MHRWSTLDLLLSNEAIPNSRGAAKSLSIKNDNGNYLHTGAINICAPSKCPWYCSSDHVLYKSDHVFADFLQSVCADKGDTTSVQQSGIQLNCQSTVHAVDKECCLNLHNAETETVVKMSALPRIKNYTNNAARHEVNYLAIRVEHARYDTNASRKIRSGIHSQQSFAHYSDPPYMLVEEEARCLNGTLGASLVINCNFRFIGFVSTRRFLMTGLPDFTRAASIVVECNVQDKQEFWCASVLYYLHYSDPRSCFLSWNLHISRLCRLITMQNNSHVITKYNKSDFSMNIKESAGVEGEFMRSGTTKNDWNCSFRAIHNIKSIKIKLDITASPKYDLLQDWAQVSIELNVLPSRFCNRNLPSQHWMLSVLEEMTVECIVATIRYYVVYTTVLKTARRYNARTKGYLTLVQSSVPTAAQSVTHMTLPSCTGSDRYCSSERGIGQEQHLVALEFAHQNPPFEFYVPRSPSVDNSIDSRIMPQSTGAGLVPQNTQCLAGNSETNNDNKMPAMSFSFSAVSLTSFTTQWETGGNNDSGVEVSPTEPDFVSNDGRLCLPVQVTDDEERVTWNTGLLDEVESDRDSSRIPQQEFFELY
ncbi:uncharacterized protein [Dysidea avara]|uniref:uncharacterized protein n=1 Tax=Dysidea avara TaxID=196820 RepID=UPI00332C8611